MLQSTFPSISPILIGEFNTRVIPVGFMPFQFNPPETGMAILLP